MKRMALLAALSLVACGVNDTHAANKFHIGGAQHRHLEHRHAAHSFPVAVGYGGGCCGHNYFGDGGFSNLYNQGFIPVPPYFALHPPVYYSAPVPRSYGYSPFAYPGTVMTPQITLGPEEIINPHVEPEEVPEPAQESSTRTAAAPQVIHNPFVEQAQVVSFTADVDDGSSR